MRTFFLLGAFSIPFMSSIDLVLARTMILPSGRTRHFNLVPGSARRPMMAIIFRRWLNQSLGTQELGNQRVRQVVFGSG